MPRFSRESRHRRRRPHLVHRVHVLLQADAHPPPIEGDVLVMVADSCSSTCSARRRARGCAGRSSVGSSASARFRGHRDAVRELAARWTQHARERARAARVHCRRRRRRRRRRGGGARARARARGVGAHEPEAERAAHHDPRLRHDRPAREFNRAAERRRRRRRRRRGGGGGGVRRSRGGGGARHARAAAAAEGARLPPLRRRRPRRHQGEWARPPRAGRRSRRGVTGGAPRLLCRLARADGVAPLASRTTASSRASRSANCGAVVWHGLARRWRSPPAPPTPAVWAAASRRRRVGSRALALRGYIKPASGRAARRRAGAARRAAAPRASLPK